MYSKTGDYILSCKYTYIHSILKHIHKLLLNVLWRNSGTDGSAVLEYATKGGCEKSFRRLLDVILNLRMKIKQTSDEGRWKLIHYLEMSFLTLTTIQTLQVHQHYFHLISIFLLENHQAFILFLQTKQLFEHVNLHLHAQVFLSICQAYSNASMVGS